MEPGGPHESTEFAAEEGLLAVPAPRETEPPANGSVRRTGAIEGTNGRPAAARRAASAHGLPATVHPTAHVHPGAELGPGVRVGPGAVIGAEVRLGARVEVGPHVVLDGRVEIGPGTRLWPGAVVGAEPQDLSFRGVPSGVRIGAECDVREHATVHRSTCEDGWTTIGDRVLLMASSHVAHDCVLDDRVILAGGALLAGHVHLAERAFVSGNVVVHQFSRIGRLAMIGGNSRVNRDVLPFALLVGDSRLRGMNVVGLKRAGIAGPARAELRDAFRRLRAARTFDAALEELEGTLESDEGRELLAFVRAGSKRGYCTF